MAPTCSLRSTSTMRRWPSGWCTCYRRSRASVLRTALSRRTLPSSARQPWKSHLNLTPREKDVLLLLAEGASNKAIAQQLGISVHTAKFHVGSILEKHDATGGTTAV